MKAKRIIQIVSLSLLSLLCLGGLVVFLPSGEMLGKVSAISTETKATLSAIEEMVLATSADAMPNEPPKQASESGVDIAHVSIDSADMQSTPSEQMPMQTPSEATPTQIVPVVDDTQDISEGLQVQVEEVSEPDVRYVVARIKASHPKQIKTAFAQGKYGKSFRAYPSKIAKDNQAVIAINGDYYGFRNEGIIIRNGKLYRNHPSGKHLLMIDQNGDFHTMEEREADGEALIEQGAWQTFSFGPAVVIDGEAQEPPQKYFISRRVREPRTAIGQTGPLEYVMVAVEGRSKASQGMSLTELGELMEKLGCETAYNLDGGGTSTMIFHDDVINRVSGKGERASSDIIYFDKLG